MWARLSRSGDGRSFCRFQSTRPVWGATQFERHRWRWTGISIHTPRVGRDKSKDGGEHVAWHFNPHAPCGARRKFSTRSRHFMNFNPHAPCGARRRRWGRKTIFAQFQSTRPVWGATRKDAAYWFKQRISIHTPRVWRDRGVLCSPIRLWNFNPHAPCGARPLHLI